MIPQQISFGGFSGCSARRPTSRRRKTSIVRPAFTFSADHNLSVSRKVNPDIPTLSPLLGFTFDAELQPLAAIAGRPLASLEVDWMHLALVVYAADRLAPRFPYGQNSRCFWRRKLSVSLPVVNLERFAALQTTIEEILGFLTEDCWSIHFRPGRERLEVENQQIIRTTSSAAKWACLFSGGLDSLAGSIEFLSKGSPLLISGVTHTRLGAGQQELVSNLRKEFRTLVNHVAIRYGFDSNPFEIGNEPSQRTRGFLHVCLGVVTAFVAGLRELHMFENGFGALNLACDSSQIGSQNTRSTHPAFLKRMEGFASQVSGGSFSIVNPYRFSTKGEVLRADWATAHSQLLQKTFSCDRFPNYHESVSQCGHCPSCLIRRLAFFSAGLPDNPATYARDVLKGTGRIRDGHWHAFLKLNFQAEHLREKLSSVEPWPGLRAKWPALMEVERLEADYPPQVISLLHRHIAEWSAFSAEIQRNFWPLAA